MADFNSRDPFLPPDKKRWNRKQGEGFSWAKIWLLAGKKGKRRGMQDNLRFAEPEIRHLAEKKDEEPTKDEAEAEAEEEGKILENNAEEKISKDTKEFPAQQIPIFNQVVAALSVSLVSLAVGYASGYTSPALPSMTADPSMNVSTYESTWVVSLLPLAAIMSGIFGGVSVDWLGRRSTILGTALMLSAGAASVALAPDLWAVYLGRFLTGFAIGIASLALPVYLGETVRPEVRGTLGLMPTAFGNIGILLVFTGGIGLDWRGLAWLGAALPLPFLLLVLRIPETPRWYISKGKTDQAKSALLWLRGGKERESEAELAELLKTDTGPEGSVRELLQRSNLKLLLISLGLMFFQQCSGINAVIFYTLTIFKIAGTSVDGNLSTVIVGVVNFVSTFVAAAVIDKLGRKILLYISAALMALTLFGLATFFLLRSHGYILPGWLPLACFVGYVVAFSLGFGPVPWLMLGEILPARVRGPAASIATAFNWTCTFVVTKTFMDLVQAMGTHGAFYLFGAVCSVALVFVAMWVPETQGQSLEDIERKLAGIRVRRLSSRANLRPMPSTLG